MYVRTYVCVCVCVFSFHLWNCSADVYELSI